MADDEKELGFEGKSLARTLLGARRARAAELERIRAEEAAAAGVSLPAEPAPKPE